METARTRSDSFPLITTYFTQLSYCPHCLLICFQLGLRFCSMELDPMPWFSPLCLTGADIPVFGAPWSGILLPLYCCIVLMTALWVFFPFPSFFHSSLIPPLLSFIFHPYSFLPSFLTTAPPHIHLCSSTSRCRLPTPKMVPGHLGMGRRVAWWCQVLPRLLPVSVLAWPAVIDWPTWAAHMGRVLIYGGVCPHSTTSLLAGKFFTKQVLDHFFDM